MEEKNFYVDDALTDNTVLITGDRKRAVETAIDLAAAEGSDILLSDDDGAVVYVSRFKDAFNDAKRTGFGLIDMGYEPFRRGDNMNEYWGTDKYDPEAVYDTESGEVIIGWKESIRTWF